MTHEIKIKRTFVKPILNGQKCFEIRKNDRGYQKGDRIRFHVDDYYPENAQEEDAIKLIESKTYMITYVLNGWGLKRDYVAFGIMEVDK